MKEEKRILVSACALTLLHYTGAYMRAPGCGSRDSAHPHLGRGADFVLLGAALGAVHAVAFVAIGAALSEATTPATRGLAMGGYSTAIYVGLGLASISLGPVMVRWGYGAGFTLAGVAGAFGTCLAAIAWGESAHAAEPWRV
ncbi:MAG: hypothetical protein HY724_08155 [Candidatus Rokubacteria bacterium]|nr:hypothetical protein [Candidatus Rokubacteria bacterium]